MPTFRPIPQTTTPEKFYGPPMQAEEQLKLECMRILMNWLEFRELNPPIFDAAIADGKVCSAERELLGADGEVWVLRVQISEAVPGEPPTNPTPRKRQ